MIPNMLVVVLAALIPMLIGFLYYNPKLLGTVWMKEAGMTEEKMQGGNMVKMLLLSFVCAFLFSAFLFGFVVHQTDVYSLYASETGFGAEGSAVMNRLDTLMLEFGDRFRTFGHGAFHGTFIGLLFVVPILGTNAIFERKSFKYVAVNGGYWIITSLNGWRSLPMGVVKKQTHFKSGVPIEVGVVTFSTSHDLPTSEQN